MQHTMLEGMPFNTTPSQNRLKKSSKSDVDESDDLTELQSAGDGGKDDGIDDDDDDDIYPILHSPNRGATDKVQLKPQPQWKTRSRSPAINTTTTAEDSHGKQRLSRSLSPIKRSGQRALDLPISKAELLRRSARQELEELGSPKSATTNTGKVGHYTSHVLQTVDASELCTENMLRYSSPVTSDELERLSHIDCRLEKLYHKKIKLRRRRQQNHLDPLPQSPVVGATRHSNGTRDEEDQHNVTLESKGDEWTYLHENDTHELLNELEEKTRSSLHPSNSRYSSSIQTPRVDQWLRELSEAHTDPVQIGKECIEVCGTEFDACLQFLREDLNFLQKFIIPAKDVQDVSVQSMVGSIDLVPQKVTDACWQRSAKLLRLWRAEHRVLYFLLERYEDERRVYQRDTDPSLSAALEQANEMLHREVQLRDSKIVELQQALDHSNDILQALAVCDEEDQEFQLLRLEISRLKPSGVTDALERLLQHMRKVAFARRQRLERSWSDYSVEDGSRRNSRQSHENVNASESSAGGPRDNRQTLFERVRATKSSGEGEDVEDEETDVYPDAVDEVSEFDEQEPERNEYGKVVVVGGSNKRRSSLALQDRIENHVQKLDGIQQSQVMANWLTKVANEPHLKAMIMELDEAGQRSLVASLLESAADGRATNFIREVLRQTKSSRDRVDLVLEFMQLLDADELDMIAPNVVTTMSSKRLLTIVNDVQGTANKPGHSPTIEWEEAESSDRTANKYSQTDLSIPMYEHPGDNARRLIIKAIKKSVDDENYEDDENLEDDENYEDDENLEDDEDGEDDEDDEDNEDERTKDGKALGKESELETETAETKAAEGDNCDDLDANEVHGDSSKKAEKDGEDQDKDLKSPNTSETSMQKPQKQKSKRSKLENTTFATVSIRNKSLLKEGGELAVMVTLRRIEAKFITPLLNESLPWEKYLHKPPKHRRARKIEISQLEDVIIGEVYQKKVQSDKTLRESGRKSHTLAKTILHYFTQKYGLKKLAEEYLYGIVQAIRDEYEHSLRIQLFGMLVGVIDPEHYTPTLCDAIMSVFASVFPRSDLIAKALEYGTNQTVVQSTSAIRAIRTVFRLVDGDGLKASSDIVDEVDDGSGVPQRYWAMPGAFRQKILKWIDANSVPESEVNKATTSDIKVVNLDLFLSKVTQVFLSKIELDRTMIMQLFRTFDVNGDGVLSFEEFQKLLSTAQPQPPLNEAQVMDLWIEVNDHEDDDDDDKITPEAFATICIRRNLELPYWKYDNENIMVCLIKELEDKI